MNYKVPQFIEHELKIVGPLTLKQFIFVAIAGAISLFLFFTIAGNSFFLWLVITLILMGTATALVFLQIEGVPLYLVVEKSLSFFTKPRIYLWKKKSFSPKLILLSKPKEEEPIMPNRGTTLRTAEKSRLKQLWNEIELK